MILYRLTAMSGSTFAAVRDAFNHSAVIEAATWVERIVAYDGSVLDTYTKRTNHWAY